MNNILKVGFVLAGLSMISTSLKAQEDSILFLNGKVHKGDIGRSGNGIIELTRYKKNGKTKKETIEEYRVFSFVKDGKEKITYVQDDFLDNFLTISEAKAATYGSYDARLTCKPHFAFWSSFSIGLGVSLFDTYLTQKDVDDPETDYTEKGFFKSQPSIAPFLVPPVLMGIWAIPKTKIRHKHMLHPNFKGDDNYFRGYHRIARQKRMLWSLSGGFIGVSVGLITYFILR